MSQSTISVLGAGSWGTALAIHLARCGHTVNLWGHREEHIQDLLAMRENARFLPGISFPSSLTPSLVQSVFGQLLLLAASFLALSWPVMQLTPKSALGFHCALHLTWMHHIQIQSDGDCGE